MDVETVYNNAAARIANGSSEAQVINEMKNSGLDDADIAAIMPKLRSSQSLVAAQAKVEEAKGQMTRGAVFLVIGLIITIVSYSMVADSGGTYLICYGPVIFGGLRLFRGMAAHGSAKRELEALQGEG